MPCSEGGDPRASPSEASARFAKPQRVQPELLPTRDHAQALLPSWQMHSRTPVE